MTHDVPPPPGVQASSAGSVVQRGTARSVIDYISWMMHVDWVHSLCDSGTTAMAVFNCFTRSASAERGRYVEGIRTVA